MRHGEPLSFPVVFTNFGQVVVIRVPVLSSCF